MKGWWIMPDILVRGLDARTIKRLKDKARREGRSLQSEAKLTLERAAGTGAGEITQILDRWKTRFKGRRLSSSVEIIRRDRAR
jgi:plasmid stability protein